MTALNAATAANPARPTLRLSPRRTTAVAALAAGAALILTGCSAGQITQTSHQAAAINGNNADIGRISLRNVHIIYPATDTHTNSEGGKAVLALSIVNTGETVTDELTSITTDLGSVRITPAEGSKIELSPQETVVAADSATEAAGQKSQKSTNGTNQSAGARTEDPAADSALIEITGLTKDITPGLTYTVSFNFKENGTIQMQVPVDAGTEAERQVTELSKSTEGSAH
ncbi:hypothetical protein [Nocardia donostiensis]|uniref:hypothetical protein n=1 Tax=Nocardia donostiensis TaxID=1538463 RepID=UPI001FEA6C16|nr:hypothetical protein [Nocardia donostiensis]